MLLSASHAEMKENVGRMDRLRHKFAEDDDKRLLTAIQDVLAEATEAAKLKEADARDLIQSLVARNAELKAAAEYPGTPEAHDQKLEQMSQAQRQAEENLQTAQTRIWQEEVREQELLNQEMEVEDAKQDLDDILHRHRPQAQSKLGLYLNITQLSWRSTEPNMISGTVSDLNNTDIREFDIDTTKYSHYEAVQQVWKHIPV